MNASSCRGRTVGVEVDYKLIGPLRVLRDGHELALGGPKQRAVMAVLLLARGRVVEFDAMIDAVWDGAPPVKAISSLRAYVANLRRVLDPDTLVTTSYGYRLRLDESEVDIARFESLAARGRAHARNGSHAAACAMFGEALEYWTGAPLEDLRDLTFSVHEIHRLQELHADVVETWFDSRLAIGHHHDILEALEEQILISPLRERLWAQLMLALYRSNRRADALLAFTRASRILHDELSIAPGIALVALEADIRGQEDTLAARSVPVPARPALLGRAMEVQSMCDAIASARAGIGGVLVVLGEPGIGKTALAAEAVVHARAAGLATAWAYPTPGIGQPNLWAWLQVLRELGESVGHEQFARAASAVPADLVQSLPGWREACRSSAATTGRSHFDVIDSIARAIRALVDGHPTMVVLDDLDRSDRGTREVLHLLAGALQQLPIVVIATGQAGRGAGRTGRSPLDTLMCRCDTTVLRLRGLSADATGQLVERVSGHAPSPGLAARLHERTGGNPFYTREIVRAMQTDSAAIDVVPESVVTLVRRRMAAVPVRTRKALRTAAVREKETGAEASDMLVGAVVSGLVTQDVRSGRVRFVSTVVRDAVAATSTRLVRVTSSASDDRRQQLTNR